MTSQTNTNQVIKMTAEEIRAKEHQFISQSIKKDSGDFKRGIKDEFWSRFIQSCEPDELIKNINGIKDIKGQKWAWDNRLAEGEENIFNDIGFSWAGHQKYAMWDCRYNEINEKDFNRKTIYYMDVDMAKTMALKYGANSIVMTERGFSLRWGCEPIRNPSEKGKFGDGKIVKGREFCGATGMGVWIINNINLDLMKQHSDDGARVSEALIKHAENNCGYNDDEMKRYINGEKINKHAGDVLWVKGGIHPNKKSANYKFMIGMAKKVIKDKKDPVLTEYKKQMKAEAKARGARVEETEEETLRNKKIRERKEKRLKEGRKPGTKKLIIRKK